MKTSKAVLYALVSLGLVFSLVALIFVVNAAGALMPSGPTSTTKPTESPKQTPLFNPKLTATPLSNNGLGWDPVYVEVSNSDGTSLSYNDLRILPGNSYELIQTASNGTVIISSNSIGNKLINGVLSFVFSVALTNPSPSVDSSTAYAIQYTVTKTDETTISPQDVTLAVNIPKTIIGIPLGWEPTSYDVNLTANFQSNQLTYLCNPNATKIQQVTGGSIIPTGYHESIVTTISFAATGTYKLSVKLVPIT